MTSLSAMDALTALIVAVILILRKVPPAYGMLAGALAGGADLTQTIALMIGGAQSVANAVLRILGAGILAGVLLESGAAGSIAETIFRRIGEKRALAALATAIMLLTATGVFMDVAVITVAPIALAIAHRADISKMAILLAMAGGGKAGNVMSPNPNAVSVAESFHTSLTSLMAAGVVPGLCGMALACLLAGRLATRGGKVQSHELASPGQISPPSFAAAICPPQTAFVLLMLRPLAGIAIDPLAALPLGGLAGLLVMGQWRNANRYMASGLLRMAPVAVMLLGSGALAGIAAGPQLKEVLIAGLQASGLPSYLLAPSSGALTSMATASTTAGAAVASAVGSATLLEMGIAALAGAAMLHAGATVLDHMPHGSFFHAAGGGVNIQIRERLKLIPYETAVGLMIAFVSTLMFGVFALAG